jgi:tetratricopeptide (TPR) repeat protein
LFALQNEITGRIAVALNLELVGAEASRSTGHRDALDYILQGRAARLKPPSRESRTEAIRMFERALALDHQSVAAQSYLATALTARVMDNMTDSAAADLARAEALAEQALAASPHNPLAHYAKGQVLRTQCRYDEAISEYETVLAFDRNWVSAYHLIGLCKLYIGPIEEVIPAQEQAIRLSPRDPVIGTLYMRIGRVHLLQSRTEEAILWLEKSRLANPAHPLSHADLASAYALKGKNERAADELAEARRLSADDRFSSLARLRAVGYWGVPKIRALYEATYFAGLRKAGMPEE